MIAIREVLFGFGLNQLSDYFEERYYFIEYSQLRNAAGMNFHIKGSIFFLFIVLGSLTAGIVCGYLTHLLHNLSALKLMFPHQSYSVHLANLQQKWITRLDTSSGLYELIPKERHVSVAKVEFNL